MIHIQYYPITLHVLHSLELTWNWMAWPRKEDHFPSTKQVVNSTSILVPGSVLYVYFTPVSTKKTWMDGLQTKTTTGLGVTAPGS